MTLISLTIPDEPDRLADWLEGCLVAGDVQRLAAELASVRGADADGISLEQVCDSHLDAIYEHGLAALPRPSLQRLLRHPRLLPELAEQIFLQGGPYWDERLAANPEDRIEPAESWARLAAALDAQKAPAPSATTLPRWRRFSSAPWVIVPLTALATAAGVLLTIRLVPAVWSAVAPAAVAPAVVAPGSDTVSERWGLLKVEDLPKNVSSADYLEAIASLAQEWHTRSADSAHALANDILALRTGCNHLQLMAHPQLSPDQAKDLVTRCHKCGLRFDTVLSSLETTHDVSKVRAEVKDIVTRLTAFLRNEATKVRRTAGA